MHRLFVYLHGILIHNLYRNYYFSLHYKVIPILIGIFLLSAHGLQAQQTMMTEVSIPYMEKLVAYAKANYPRVQALEHKLKATKYAYSRSKLAWAEVIGFNYLYSPSNTVTIDSASTKTYALVSSRTLTGYQLGINANLGSLLGKMGTTKILKEEMYIAELDIDEYFIKLESEVKQRYYNYVVRTVILSHKSKAEIEAESLSKQIKYKFEKGEETLENYSKVMTNYYAAVQTKLEAEGDVMRAKCALEEVIGVKLEQIK
ncbi:MAG: hypothetical protein EBX41_04190 [Chitinophagia bacterium]|nr:hypothetical protein [Chitinophagia bacterium]